MRPASQPPATLPGGRFRRRWRAAAGSVALFCLGLRILIPPARIVQELVSPDRQCMARLMRTRYVSRESLVVKLKNGWIWRTVFYSPAIPEDMTEPLGEEVVWSDKSQRLELRLRGRPIWAYSVKDRKSVPVRLPTGAPEPAGR